MAYDEALAEHVREALSGRGGLSERKMFGGIGFMLNGNMAVGVHGDELIVRIAPERTDEALAQPHTRVFDMTGRPMKRTADDLARPSAGTKEEKNRG